MKNSKKGITLIALVITIIVLLILAGITFTQLTSDDGILSKANYTKEETRYSQVLDESTKFKLNHETDYNNGTAMAPSLTSIVQKLQDNEIITAEEANSILGTGLVYINNKEIDFRLDLDNDNVWEDLELPSQNPSGSDPGVNNPLWKDDINFPDPAIYGPIKLDDDSIAYCVLTKTRAIIVGCELDANGNITNEALIVSAKYEFQNFKDFLKSEGATNDEISEYQEKLASLGEMNENILLIRNPISELELTPEKVEDFINSDTIIHTEESLEGHVESITDDSEEEPLTEDKILSTSEDIYTLLNQPEYIGAAAFFDNKEKAMVFLAEEVEGENKDENSMPVLVPAFEDFIYKATDYDKAFADLDKILFKTSGTYETYVNPTFSKTDFDSPVQGICVVDYENNMTNSYLVTENNTYTIGYVRPVEITQNDTELNVKVNEEIVNIGLEATKILKLPLPNSGKEYHVYVQEDTLYITAEGDKRPEGHTGFWISIPITQGLDDGEKADIFTLNENYNISNLGLIID